MGSMKSGSVIASGECLATAHPVLFGVDVQGCGHTCNFAPAGDSPCDTDFCFAVCMERKC